MVVQTGSTSCGVSLSQTNGLRLFDAVFHRNLLFIIPQARDDIGPCLPRVTLMSLIAPPVRLPTTTGSRYRDKTSEDGFLLSRSLPFPPISPSLLVHGHPSLSLSPVLFSDRRAFLVKLTSLSLCPYVGALLSPENDAVLLSPGIYCLVGETMTRSFRCILTCSRYIRVEWP